jgi:hypothetical protein
LLLLSIVQTRAGEQEVRVRQEVVEAMEEQIRDMETQFEQRQKQGALCASQLWPRCSVAWPGADSAFTARLPSQTGLPWRRSTPRSTSPTPPSWPNASARRRWDRIVVCCVRFALWLLALCALLLVGVERA